MLIVAGHLELEPIDRDAHIAASVTAVRLARATPGCLDFAVSADPVDPSRVNVFERWADAAHLRAFRDLASDDPPDVSRIRAFHVDEYEL